MFAFYIYLTKYLHHITMKRSTICTIVSAANRSIAFWMATYDFHRDIALKRSTTRTLQIFNGIFYSINITVPCYIIRFKISKS